MKTINEKIDFEKVDLHCRKNIERCGSCLIGKISRINSCNGGDSDQLVEKFALEEKYPENVINSMKIRLQLNSCTIIGLHNNKLVEEKEFKKKMKTILE